MGLQVVCTGKLVVALCHKRTQGRWLRRLQTKKLRIQFCQLRIRKTSAATDDLRFQSFKVSCEFSVLSCFY